MLGWDVGRDRVTVEEEETTILPSVGQYRMQGKKGTLQKIQKVLLRYPTSKGQRYVPVDEKGL